MADTDNTAPSSENTDNSEQSGNGAENNNQDKLSQYERRVEELDGERKRLEEAAKKAQAEAVRWQSSYRTLQNNTTASLQEASRIRQQLNEQQRIHDELVQTRAEMTQVREGLSFLASRMVDEDAAKEFQLRQRESQLKQMETLAQQRMAALQSPQQPQQPQQAFTPYVDIDEQKRQFLNYYFPDSGIDHSDPAIDWGEGLNDTREAFRRFTTSVQARLREGQPQNQETQVQSETERLLADLRREREEFATMKNSTLEEIKAQARKEVETRLRNVGADAGNLTASTESARQAATRLNEIDERRLNEGEPTARKKAAAAMEAELRALRDQLINRQ